MNIDGGNGKARESYYLHSNQLCGGEDEGKQIFQPGGTGRRITPKEYLCSNVLLSLAVVSMCVISLGLLLAMAQHSICPCPVYHSAFSI